MMSTATTITKIIVNGASGRMGSRVCALALSDESFALLGALERDGSLSAVTAPGGAGMSARTPKIAAGSAQQPEVVVDFSSDEGARIALRAALSHRAALLVGTTALSVGTTEMLREASKQIAVLVAPNTSLGVAAVSKAAAMLGSALGSGYEVSIIEAHHSKKKDAPSGTALRLAGAVRSGGATVREDQVLSVRGGDVVGEHTIRFAGPGEYIELTHRATTRDLFAMGALRAAAWLRGRAAGWWTIEDVLGLEA